MKTAASQVHSCYSTHTVGLLRGYESREEVKVLMDVIAPQLTTLMEDGLQLPEGVCVGPQSHTHVQVDLYYASDWKFAYVALCGRC